MKALWLRFHRWWTQPGPRKWRGVALVVPFVVLMLLGIGYTNYVQRQADQRWCGLFIILDAQYQSVPPETEIGRRFAVVIHNLREDLDC